MRAILPRIVLALFLGGSVALLVTGDWIDVGTYRFACRLSSTTDGVAQLFRDSGVGFNESESGTVSLSRSDEPIPLSISIPPGRYQAFRFDPNNTPGTFTLVAPRIEDAVGRVVFSIPIDTLQPSPGVVITSRSTDAISLTAADGVGDPQVVFTSPRPIVLEPSTASVSRLLAAVLSFGALAFVLLTVVDWLLMRRRVIGRGPTWVESSPEAAIVIAAALASIGATYPLLVGRSLVSPTNGAVVMLYDKAPFVPGTGDVISENPRGADTGSMMWGILPYSQVQRQALAAGEWPLWLRYSGLGRPLWGQGQSMFLDPLHLLSLIVDDPASGWDFKFFIARAVFSIGIGLAAYAATASVAASVLAGIAAPFFGFFIFRLNHPATFSMTYVPWLFWAFTMLAKQIDRRGLIRWASVLAVVTALHLVASTPKEGAISLLAALLIGGLTNLFSSTSMAMRVSRTAAFCGGALAGLFLAAPHWLVFLDTLSRAWTVYDTPQARFASWPNIRNLVLGAAEPGTLAPGANLIVGLGVVLAAFAWSRWWKQPVIAVSGLVAIGFLGISMGLLPPSLLFKIPLLRNLHMIDYAFVGATIVPLAIVAAAGYASIDDVFADSRRAIACFIVSTGCALILIAGLGGLAGLTRPLNVPAVVGIAAALALPWMWWCARDQTSTRLAIPATALLTALILLPGGLHLDTGVPLLDHVLMQPRPRVDLDRESPAIQTAKAIEREPFRAIGFDHTFFPGTQALYGVEGLIGADAIELPQLRELGVAAGMFNHPWGWISIFQEAELKSMSGLLDLFGVRVVFAPAELKLPIGRSVPVVPPERLQVIERPTAWPRAFFVDRVAVYDQPVDLVKLLAQASQPFVAVQASDAAARTLVESRIGPATAYRRAVEYRLTPNTTTFRVSAPAAGIATLNEAYSAGDFTASLNGEPVPYFRVNHMMKAVAIPGPGEWTVAFEYRPALWQLGWGLSLSMAACLIAAVLLSQRVKI